MKEFKTTASAVIKKVEDGAAYVVTERGRPVAVLLPLEEAEDAVLANGTSTSGCARWDGQLTQAGALLG